MRTAHRIVGALALAAALHAPPAGAQEPGLGLGARMGFGIDPDQFVVGVQSLLGRSLVFRFAPSFDLGLGDDATTYTFNGDFVFHLGVPKSRWRAYVGAGVGVAYWNFEEKLGLAGSQSQPSADDTEIGVNVLGGVRRATEGWMNFNLEARFGLGDLPDFRLLVGVLFG